MSKQTPDVMALNEVAEYRRESADTSVHGLQARPGRPDSRPEDRATMLGPMKVVENWLGDDDAARAASGAKDG